MPRYKFLTVSLSAFTLAMLGLMVILFVQSRHTTEINETLFNNNVSSAMDNVLQQVGRLSLEEFVGADDREIITQYRRIDELNSRMIKLLEENQSIFFDIKRVRLNVVLRDSAELRNGIRLSPSEASAVEQYNSLLTVRNRLIEENNNRSGEKTLNEMTEDDFFSNAHFKYALLESIIHDELAVTGITDKPDIAVIDATSDKFLYASKHAKKEALHSTPYKYSFRLRALPSSHEYSILLKFPSKYRFIHTYNNIFLIISILLMIVILLTFYTAIRTIFSMRKLDEMKTTFINNMTHEIRTPIATIALTCEMLNDPTVQSDETMRRNFVNAIASENRRMRMLAETILQNAKMSDPNFTMNRQEIDLNEIAQSAIESFNLVVSQRGGTIESNLDPNISAIYADSLHISNMIHNLIDNAIKYSNGQPWILVHTQAGDDVVKLTIQDHGIGIAKEDQKHIFDKFYRVSTGDIHNVKGFGIGLNYVSNVVNMHHGTIELESTEGVGSTFTITLPCHPMSESKTSKRHKKDNKVISTPRTIC